MLNAPWAGLRMGIYSGLRFLVEMAILRPTEAVGGPAQSQWGSEGPPLEATRVQLYLPSEALG